MPRSRSYTLASPYETYQKKISELKNQLYEARWDIVGVMAPEIGQRLRSYYSCQNRKDLYAWERNVVDFVIGLAKPIPEASYFEKRGRCPLCGSSGNSYYADGYKIPGGLEQHLMGRGTARYCPVMKAAWELAHDALKPTFVEADKKAKDALEARRKTEPVFLVNPFDQPGLLDECFWKSPRDQDGLTRAEERLSRLGFELSTSENVKSYKLEADTYVVYADPRYKGRISFVVYAKPLPKKRASASSSSFSLLDFWKNDLVSKFNTLLAEAQRRL